MFSEFSQFSELGDINDLEKQTFEVIEKNVNKLVCDMNKIKYDIKRLNEFFKPFIDKEKYELLDERTKHYYRIHTNDKYVLLKEKLINIEHKIIMKNLNNKLEIYEKLFEQLNEFVQKKYYNLI